MKSGLCGGKGNNQLYNVTCAALFSWLASTIKNHPHHYQEHPLVLWIYFKSFSLRFNGNFDNDVTGEGHLKESSDRKGE